MNVKLLKRLRQQGMDVIHINSYTTTGGIVTGMSYGQPDDPDYAHIFSYGDTPDDVRKKACRIYMEKEVKYLKEKRDRKADKRKKRKHCLWDANAVK